MIERGFNTKKIFLIQKLRPIFKSGPYSRASIIGASTRDAIQKEVFGMGYKNLPVMSIEEFYEERAQNGWYSKPAPSLQNYTIAAADEGPPTEDDEAAIKDSKEDNDDPDELERQRNFDEYKDEHQRGEGN